MTTIASQRIYSKKIDTTNVYVEESEEPQQHENEYKETQGNTKMEITKSDKDIETRKLRIDYDQSTTEELNPEDESQQKS